MVGGDDGVVVTGKHSSTMANTFLHLEKRRWHSGRGRSSWRCHPASAATVVMRVWYCFTWSSVSCGNILKQPQQLLLENIQAQGHGTRTSGSHVNLMNADVSEGNLFP